MHIKCMLWFESTRINAGFTESDLRHSARVHELHELDKAAFDVLRRFAVGAPTIPIIEKC